MSLLVERKQIRDAIAHCQQCHLADRHTPVPFSGPSQPSYAVLGEAPGREEDRAGAPFVGLSGRLLRRCFTAQGVDVSTVAFVNTVCCYPERTPTGQEVAACRGNLDAQLAHLRCDRVLVVGGVALTALWGREAKIGEFSGKWFAKNGKFFYPALHPAAILRDRTLEPAWRVSLDLFVNGGPPWPSYHCVKCGTYTETMVDRDLLSARIGIPFCGKHLAAEWKRENAKRRKQWREAQGMML